jgi:hypothetical protein
MGHSGKLAEKHYLQVTDEHWSTAANLSPTAPPIGGDSEPISKNHKTKKPSVLLGLDGSGCVKNTYLVTPTGLEHAHNSQAKFSVSDLVPMPVPISGPITSDLAEFLSLWDELDKSARCELLAVARRLTPAVTERSS